jgi:hypothetical protein
MSESTENKQSSPDSNSSGDDSYVDNAYQTAFGRSADSEGKAYWVHELQTGHIDRGTLLTTLSSSPEGQAHISLVGITDTPTV